MIVHAYAYMLKRTFFRLRLVVLPYGDRVVYRLYDIYLSGWKAYFSTISDHTLSPTSSLYHHTQPLLDTVLLPVLTTCTKGMWICTHAYDTHESVSRARGPRIRLLT